MRILDIDLDFFISPIPHPSFEGRLSNSYDVWSTNDVINFLENNLRISTKSKIKGRIITNHNEAYFFWKELVKKGNLKIPFEIVHIDSHSDLGLGNTGWVYITTELLHLQLKERCNPDKAKINEGNFLPFALACEWISKIDFIYPSAYDFMRDKKNKIIGRDIFSYCFKNYNINGKNLIIQLYRMNIDDLEATEPYPMIWENVKGIPIGPEVPFNLISWKDYENNNPFSFVNLSKSPAYTPETVDPLIDVIKNYIFEI